MGDMNAARASRLTSALAIATAVVALAVFTMACGDGDEAPGASLEVTGQWARTSPAGATSGAAYLTITSPVDDTLTGVEVDASVAETAEMHETTMATGTTMAGMGSETTMAGMGEMTMQPVASIELPAGVAVAMKPGGYHVMLMGLTEPLEQGGSITLTLTLRNAGAVVVTVPVLDEAP
ncbi:MAG: copper chaperone PCu(A)C [Actinomycetota bacterium]